MNAPIRHLLPRRRTPRVARAKAPDIVLDTIETLAAVLGQDGLRVTPAQRQRAESQVRDLWGGNRVYVGKQASVQTQARAQRDLDIAEAWRRGTPIEALAFRHGLTPRRIKQIIDGIFKWKLNCLNHFHGQS